jgi:hypothetical protein
MPVRHDRPWQDLPIPSGDVVTRVTERAFSAGAHLPNW